MSGIFTSLGLASKGLSAQQSALQTTAHNIANANTEGYSRQRVEFKADLAYSLGGVGQIGTGVKMESIIRLVDDYVSRQIRQENGTMNKFAMKSDVLEQLEYIFNEPSDTGLNSNLEKMFNSWQELSKNPESTNSKSIVVENSKTLADTFNHMMRQMDNLTTETIEGLEKEAYDFNQIIDQLESLNGQIFNVAIKGEIPNDLLDKRDLLLKNLSSITNFEANFDKYGKVGIEIGGTEVLGKKQELEMSVITDIRENEDGDKIVYISKQGDSLATEKEVALADFIDISGLEEEDLFLGQVILNNPDVDFKVIKAEDSIIIPSISKGRIDGNYDALNEIKERKDDLAKFAEDLAEAINSEHNKGYVSGTTIDIFEFDKDTERLSVVVKGEEIRAGAEGSAEGDGSLALAIAGLKNKKNAIGGTTVEGAYIDIVTKVGISRQHAISKVENQEVVLGHLDIRRESTSGVNLDEEFTNLLKYSSAFDANARVIQTLSEMLDTLIHRTGV